MKNPNLGVLICEYDELRFCYTDENNEVIDEKKYSFAKSFYGEYAFVYESYLWDIINTECKSVVNILEYSEIIQIALRNIVPQDFFFIKNYNIGQNLIMSVDFLRLKSELLKLFPIEYEQGRMLAPWKDYFHWNYSQQALFVINICKPNLCFSFIEDITLPGEGLVGIKTYGGDWRYITIDDFNEHEFEKKAFDFKLDKVYTFVNGLAKVKLNGLFGFIDLNGKIVIPIIYDDARSFNEGVAPVAIANCRRKKGDKNKYYSDLRWNFIDKSNRKVLSETSESLTKVKNGDYYFYNNEDLHPYNCANIDKVKMNLQKGPSEIYGGKRSLHSAYSNWATADSLGQLMPAYLIDLLMGANKEELGFRYLLRQSDSARFKGYWGIETFSSAYEIVKDLYDVNEYVSLEIDTLHIDFDSTQSELDFITGVNSLLLKYGDRYELGHWKSIKKTKFFDSDEEIGTDWSNYNDNLDMREQSQDFWDQF